MSRMSQNPPNQTWQSTSSQFVVHANFCLIANFENSFKSENTDTDMTVNFFPHEKPRQKQVQNADKGRP